MSLNPDGQVRVCGHRDDQTSVAYIPFPDRPGRAGQIELCEWHASQAIGRCYFVQRYDETESQAVTRFERLVEAKHRTLKRAADVSGVTDLGRVA